MRFLVILIVCCAVGLVACTSRPVVVQTMINGGANASDGNSSWNEAYARGIFCLPDGTNCPVVSGGNSSWNESRYWNNASASFTTFGYVQDNYPTFAYTHTYVASVGNWTQDRNNYYNTSQGVLDNRSWNETRANALYYPLSSNPAGYLTSYAETDPVWSAMKTSLPNLTYAEIVTSIGNWSLDKPSYTTTTAAATLYVRNSTIPTCAGTDKLTSAGNGVFTCATDQTGGGLGFSAINRSNVDASTNVNTTWVRLNVSLFLPANRNLTVECKFIVNTSATTTGLQFMFNYTGGRNVMSAYEYFNSATAKTGIGNSGNLTVLATGGQGLPIVPAFYFGGIETTSAGTFDVYYKTEVSNSFVTIYRSSACSAYGAS